MTSVTRHLSVALLITALSALAYAAADGDQSAAPTKTDAPAAAATKADAPAAPAEPAKELTVPEIVEKANLAAYYQGKSGKAQVKMTIYDSAKDKESGNARTRSFLILRKNIQAGGDQYFYVYFEEPPDVRKMVYRVWKHVGKDDDRWLYLPALDLVKRVAPGDKRTSFVGSHFVYEDVSGRGIDEDEHTLLKDECTDTQWVLKNVPKKPDEVEFASYKMWIDKKTFLPVKTEYTNKQGKVYRTVEAGEIKVIDEKYPTVMKSTARDLETGGETVNEFVQVKYDIDVDDGVFTEERYLRRAPKEARSW